MSTKILILLLLIILLGALLRFYGLDIQSFWNDELSIWKKSNYDTLSQVLTQGAFMSSSHHPPLYRIIIFLVEKYLGESEIMLRLPSALSGMLSIIAIFMVGCRIYTYKEGLIASALMAVLWCPIYYSQEARSYSMLLLFTLLATYFWIGIIRRLDQKNSLPPFTTLGYILASIISSFLHYFGLYFIALQGLAGILFFLNRRQALIRFVLLYVCIPITYIPWLLMLQPEYFGGYIIGDTTSWIQLTPNKSFLHFLGFLFNESKPLLALVLFLYASLLFRSIYSLWRTRKGKSVKALLFSPGFVLGLWIVVPFISMYIVSVLLTPVLLFRTLLISLPAAYILLARSITQFRLGRVGQIVLVVTLIAIFLFNLIVSKEYYVRPTKEQFREAVEFIVDYDLSDGRSLIVGYASHEDYFNYYFSKSGSSNRIDIMAGTSADIDLVQKMLQENQANYEFLWYIRAHSKPAPEFLVFLDDQFELIQHQSFIGADVWLFDNPPFESRSAYD